jgi:hypothetical protein
LYPEQPARRQTNRRNGAVLFLARAMVHAGSLLSITREEYSPVEFGGQADVSPWITIEYQDDSNSVPDANSLDGPKLDGPYRAFKLQSVFTLSDPCFWIFQKSARFDAL